MSDKTEQQPACGNRYGLTPEDATILLQEMEETLEKKRVEREFWLRPASAEYDVLTARGIGEKHRRLESYIKISRG